jgi:membrane dipeptidase
MFLFDAHCDTLSRCLKLGEGLCRNTGHIDLTRALGLGTYCQIFAIFANGGGWEQVLEQYDLFLREMEQNKDWIIHCRTGEQICEAVSQGKAAALLSIEGGELLNCDPEMLSMAHAMGVRAVNLTWNHANALSGSCIDQPERGLSDLGKTFVAELERLGILADVSHLSEKGFWDLAEMAQKPFIASHSNAKSVHFHPRNLTNEQITAIINANGIIGLNLYADFLGEDPGLHEIIAHIEHILSLGGAGHLAIGADFDGCDLLPSGICDIGDMERLREALLRRGYTETLLEGIFHSNLLRVVNDVCIM